MDVVIQHIPRQQLALMRLAARVADRTRRASRKRNGVVPQFLKTAQAQERYQVADVKTVRRGIEAGINRDRTSGYSLTQFVPVRACGSQPTPLQFLENAHGFRIGTRSSFFSG